MEHQMIRPLGIIASLVFSGFVFFNSSSIERSNYSSNGVDRKIAFDDQKRELLLGITDPKSVEPKPSGDVGDNAPESKFVREEASLDGEFKYAEPGLFVARPPGPNGRDVVVDVVGVGSETRPEYLKAQIETWASHVDVRHYWGLTERDDYDPNCSSASDDAVTSFVDSCRRGSMGWDPRFETFRGKFFGGGSEKTWTARTGDGATHGATRAGWFCAQRRPGRALGWLSAMYRDEEMIPDVLVFVDDDTSLDVENMKLVMLRSDRQDGPFAGAGCKFKNEFEWFYFGGFGTFINKAALRIMTRPIFCDKRGAWDKQTRSICKNLKKNRIGELDAFQEGDSVFDVFFKYSALREFCLHSDWAMGYMLTFYSGGSLDQVGPRNCRKDGCKLGDVACHHQSPKDMEEFAAARYQGLTI